MEFRCCYQKSVVLIGINHPNVHYVNRSPRLFQSSSTEVTTPNSFVRPSRTMSATSLRRSSASAEEHKKLVDRIMREVEAKERFDKFGVLIKTADEFSSVGTKFKLPGQSATGHKTGGVARSFTMANL